MMAKFSQVSNQQLLTLPCEKRCKACGLYINQPPSYSQQKQSHIFWVGLSAVRFGIEEEGGPLSSTTPTGSLIAAIEKPFLKHFSFYRTNLVKCLPLRNEKIRYPITHEMKNCFPNLQEEIKTLKPSLVFLLGKQVSSFTSESLMKSKLELDKEFNYDSFTLGKTTYIPIHHPSYVLIYRRKYLADYINNIQYLIEYNLLHQYDFY